MNAREKIFAEEYVAGESAIQAALKAGYTKQTAIGASRWLDPKNPKKYKPALREYIDELMEAQQSKRVSSAQEVLEFLSSVLRGEKQDEILRMDGDGVQVIDKIEAPTKDKLRAAEMLGKRYGILTDRMALSGSVPVTFADDLGE